MLFPHTSIPGIPGIPTPLKPPVKVFPIAEPDMVEEEEEEEEKGNDNEEEDDDDGEISIIADDCTEDPEGIPGIGRFEHSGAMNASGLSSGDDARGGV